MSVRLMAQAFNAELPSNQKLVLLVLCDYANDEGLSCHPSVAQVAHKSSLSDRQCKRVLKELMEHGWVSVIGNHSGGAPGSTRHYRINVKTLYKNASTGDASDTPERSLTGDAGDTGDKLTRVTPEVWTGDTGDTRGVTPAVKRGVTHDTQSTNNHQLTTNNHQGIACEAIDYLNSKIGTRYQKTGKSIGHVSARLREGNTLDDVMAVIDFKAQEWGADAKMRQYLRPETLFSQSKFPGYLAAAKASDQVIKSFADQDYSEGLDEHGNVL